jgi:hypothetical protein
MPTSSTRQTATSLRDYVERIVFDRGKITILGSLLLDGASPRTLPFRIEGEIAHWVCS